MDWGNQFNVHLILKEEAKIVGGGGGTKWFEKYIYISIYMCQNHYPIPIYFTTFTLKINQ